MSTILKALQRLEDEKAAAAPRELREELAGPPTSPRRARRWLPWLALALGLAGGVAWWRWPASDPPMAAETTPVANAAPTPRSAGVARQARLPEPASEARVPAPAPSPGLALPELPPASASPDPSPRRSPGIPQEAFSSRVEVVSRPSAKPRIPLEEPAALTRPEPPAPAVASAAEPDAAPPAEPVAAAPPAPALPSLRVEKTLWHPRPERREALVAVDGGEPRLLHEGDELAGARVAEIQPSGVIFEQAGERVRRAVGQP